MKQLIEVVDGTAEYFDYDELTEQVTISRETDVESAIEANKKLKALNPSGMGKSREIKYLGSIPLALVREIKLKTGLDLLAKENEKYLLKFLNDSAYRDLRVSEGRA